MGSTIKTRLWRHNGTDYDTVHLETDGSVVEVELQEEFTNPLNTDQLTLGMNAVYFTAYPDLKWCVDHLDGDYVYLGLYNTSYEMKTEFGANNTYAGSTIAAKCTDFLNNTIPNIAEYLENVTVEGVTNKVFIPTYYQFSGTTGSGDTSGPVFGWTSTSEANRKACVSNWSTIGNYFWLSSPRGSNTAWGIYSAGNVSSEWPYNPLGFRPEVKVRYKKTTTKILNTVISDLSSNIINGGTTPPIGKQPVNGLWFEDVN